MLSGSWLTILFYYTDDAQFYLSVPKHIASSQSQNFWPSDICASIAHHIWNSTYPRLNIFLPKPFSPHTVTISINNITLHHIDEAHNQSFIFKSSLCFSYSSLSPNPAGSTLQKAILLNSCHKNPGSCSSNLLLIATFRSSTVLRVNNCHIWIPVSKHIWIQNSAAKIIHLTCHSRHGAVPCKCA